MMVRVPMLKPTPRAILSEVLSTTPLPPGPPVAEAPTVTVDWIVTLVEGVTVLVEVGEDDAADRSKGRRHKRDQLSGRRTEDERRDDQHECGREHWEGPTTSRRVGSSASDGGDGDDGGGRRGGVERCERHVGLRRVDLRAVTVEQRDGLVKVDGGGIAAAVDAFGDPGRGGWGKI
jgi:hypothetical protein